MNKLIGSIDQNICSFESALKVVVPIIYLGQKRNYGKKEVLKIKL